ncbi:MAG TPA: PHB depolymerase family esterase [Acidimicrobiia bacterium]
MRKVVVSLATALCATAALAPTSADAAGQLPPGDQQFTIDFGGGAREYLAHVPVGAEPGRKLPVVFNFHGGGSDAPTQKAYSQMDATADRHGFIVVYPQGVPPAPGQQSLRTWNAGKCCGPAKRTNADDVGFTFAVLDDLAGRTPVDKRRVYATGISNGGMMAYRLAADASKRVAAIASVAGQVEVTKFAPSRPVPVMEFHSVDDPRALYNGGLGPPFPGTAIQNQFDSVQAGIDRWVRYDGCKRTPKTGPTEQGRLGSSDAGETATRITYTPCKQDAEVVLWKLTGAGHVWPGTPIDVSGTPRGAVLGESTKVVDANELMWEFFAKHPLSRS